MERLIPLPGKQMLAEQNDVARLGVGKHFAPEQIGVGVLQTAGERKKHRCIERLRHLAVVEPLETRLHEIIPHKFYFQFLVKLLDYYTQNFGKVQEDIPT